LFFFVTAVFLWQVEKNFLNGKLKAITAYFEKPDALGAQ
jgi:hypothetical protein